MNNPKKALSHTRCTRYARRGSLLERTAGAKNVINDAGAMVLNALRDLPPASTLRFADYGAASGSTGQQMWDMIIRNCVTPETTNGKLKWCILILQVMTFPPYFGSCKRYGETPPMLIKIISKMFLSTHAVRDFTSSSLTNHFIWALAPAMRYVSVKPMEIPNRIHAACADINSKTAFAKQAAVDWQIFC